MTTNHEVPKRALIYVRQSLDREKNGAAVERQEAKCRALADLRDWEVVDVVRDNNVSATKGVRSGWGEVLRRIEGGEVDVIVAFHLDRITRSMKDLEHLIDLTQTHNVGVATATGDIDLTNDVGRMVARILAAVAQAEVERKAARQRLQSEQRASAGQPKWSRRPFGYNLDGTPMEPEASAMRDAFKRLTNGERIADIARDMTAQGLIGTSGATITTANLSSMLRNPLYAGVLQFRGEDAGQGTWTPLVSRDLFTTAQSMRKRHGQGGRPASEDHGAWLVGVGKCGKCGAGVSRTFKARRGYAAYECPKGCVTLRQEDVDDVVFLKLSRLLADSGYQHRVTESMETDAARIRELQALLSHLTTRMDAVSDDHLEDLVPRAQYLRMIANLREEADAASTELDALEAKGEKATFDLEYFAQEYEGMSPDEKRALLRSHAAVTLEGPGRGRRNVSIQDLVNLEAVGA